MSTGKLPFVANNEYLLFQMIKENQIVYPSVNYTFPFPSL